MLQKTYEKVRLLFASGNGYLRTGDLLAAGITTLQLRQLVDDGSLEHVTHGVYWWKADHTPKPKDHRYYELQLANPKCVICMDSGLYLQGFLRTEPKQIRVATSRTDRSRMSMNFSVRRHYFAERGIMDYITTADTPAGPVQVYTIDRCVADCIRLRSSMDPAAFQDIIKKYRKRKDKDVDAFLAYANDMGIQNVAVSFLK